MKIRIHKNAGSFNRSQGGVSLTYCILIEALGGVEVEVETDSLFENQFNVVLPLEKMDEIMKNIPEHSVHYYKTNQEEFERIFKMGIRIYQRDVEAVIDDIRNDYVRCNYCGKKSHKKNLDLKENNWRGIAKNVECPHCKERDYLEDLGLLGWVSKWTYHEQTAYEINDSSDWEEKKDFKWTIIYGRFNMNHETLDVESKDFKEDEKAQMDAFLDELHKEGFKNLNAE